VVSTAATVPAATTSVTVTAPAASTDADEYEFVTMTGIQVIAYGRLLDRLLWMETAARHHLKDPMFLRQPPSTTGTINLDREWFATPSMSMIQAPPCAIMHLTPGSRTVLVLKKDEKKDTQTSALTKNAPTATRLLVAGAVWADLVQRCPSWFTHEARLRPGVEFSTFTFDLARVVGYALVWSGKKATCIKQLYVAPEEEKNNTRERLLQYVLQQLPFIGASTTVVTHVPTLDSFRAMATFYTSVGGFQPTGKVKVDIHDREMMEYVLRPQTKALLTTPSDTHGSVSADPSSRK
jgi:hypothetical protein